MNIEVKGNSGCQIDVVQEGREVFVSKSTVDPKYLDRLARQADKQIQAAKVEYQHIRVPQVYELERSAERTLIKMEYVYSKNFIEFFEQAGFEQVNYLIGALKGFIDYEVGKCSMVSVPGHIFQSKYADVRKKITNPSAELCEILDKSELIFQNLDAVVIPVGLCHGDLTFSNILFNGNNYYLIDFLDSFIETPLQDIAKIRQDTCYRWSQLMYTKPFDKIRLKIVCDRIDEELDAYFTEKYDWYRQYYRIMQLMNILRILPYAKEPTVMDYLNGILGGLVNE